MGDVIVYTSNAKVNWHYWATYCNFVTEDGVKCSEFGKHLERGTVRCPKCKWWTAIGFRQPLK